ncbi:MAG: family 43 glycosylhydrolase [Oscillospiraceae bacterium]|nr:family 43 glycosylhydrolase [Oscillospiraceae bacterium]
MKKLYAKVKSRRRITRFGALALALALLLGLILIGAVPGAAEDAPGDYDLEVVEIMVSPREIGDGSEVYIQATVTNTGTEATSFRAHFAVDGRRYDSVLFQVPLAPGLTSQIDANRQWTATPGTHTVTVSVEPVDIDYHMFRPGEVSEIFDKSEKNMSNNKKAAKLEVKDEFVAPHAMPNNPFITSIYTADPVGRVFNDRLYVFPSRDREPAYGCDRMDCYHVFSTDDMVNWVDEGEIFRSDDVPWSNSSDRMSFMWAPDCIQGADGRYYYYFPHPEDAVNDWGGTWKMGVAIAPNPWGPYEVQPHYIEGLGGSMEIDPAVFIDDDGMAYIYTGGGSRPYYYVSELNDDMVSIKPDSKMNMHNPNVGGGIPTGGVNGSSSFHEAMQLFKRNGLYYLIYADNNDGCNRLQYATSITPKGPWRWRGPYLDETGCDTSHGSIVEYRGEWYAVYHNCAVSGAGNLRSVCIDKVYFDDMGRIKTVAQTLDGISYKELDMDKLDIYLPDEFSISGNLKLDDNFGEGPLRLTLADDTTVRGDAFVNKSYTAQIDTVMAEEAGRYILRLHYAADGLRRSHPYTEAIPQNQRTYEQIPRITVTVNGSNMGQVQLRGTSGKDIGILPIQVTLRAGYNTIRLAGANTNKPHSITAISIEKAPAKAPPVPSETADLYDPYDFNLVGVQVNSNTQPAQLRSFSNNNNSATLTEVDGYDGGRFAIKLYYGSATFGRINLTVNGFDWSYVNMISTGSYDTLSGVATFTVPLNPGKTNEIKLNGVGGNNGTNANLGVFYLTVEEVPIPETYVKPPVPPTAGPMPAPSLSRAWFDDFNRDSLSAFAPVTTGLQSVLYNAGAGEFSFANKQMTFNFEGNDGWYRTTAAFDNEYKALVVRIKASAAGLGNVFTLSQLARTEDPEPWPFDPNMDNQDPNIFSPGIVPPEGVFATLFSELYAPDGNKVPALTTEFQDIYISLNDPRNGFISDMDGNILDLLFRFDQNKEGSVTINSLWLESDRKLGDITNSGDVDINDARLVLQYLVDKVKLNSIQLIYADVNRSGKVDITDARLILQYIVQKITEFPDNSGTAAG